MELKRAKGYRGLLSRNELKAEISAVVFAAKPPQLLKPISIEKHTHLIFVGEIIEPKLNDQLRYQIVSDLFAQWQEKQLENIILSLDES